MADRDQYRGYGRPSGRYYENREYETGYRGRDDWRDRDENRGFFERAGDEIRSWFSDDDERGRYRDRDDWRDQQRMNQGGHDRDRGYRPSMANRARDFSQDAREPWGGGDYAGYGATQGYRRSRFDDRGPYGQRSGGYPHDDHYNSWRQSQIDALDRDYDEYRRENRDRFDNEFSTWRGRRQEQRSTLRQVREHMEVIGSDGEHVGTVDKVSGDRIILTKSDASAGGHHHSIPCSWIQTVDERVTIDKTGDQAREKWRDEENRRALFEDESRRRDDGPHVLGRSFSGTYENR